MGWIDHSFDRRPRIGHTAAGRSVGCAVLVALLAVVAGGPVGAADLYTPPEGCTVFATVQHRQCEVSQHYTCAADPAGDQWAVYMDAKGPFFSSHIDAETRWLESFDIDDGGTETMTSEADPASFSTLTAKGRDDYDFIQTASDGSTRHYVGYDKLTGQVLTISGIRMERTEFDLTAYADDGSVLWRRTGNDLIQRDWKLFFGDRERFENSYGDKEETVSTPVTVALPGQPGFLTQKPEFDCDMMMTRADHAQLPAPSDGDRS